MKKAGLAFPWVNRMMSDNAVGMPGAVVALYKTMVVGVPGSVLFRACIIRVKNMDELAGYFGLLIICFLGEGNPGG